MADSNVRSDRGAFYASFWSIWLFYGWLASVTLAGALTVVAFLRPHELPRLFPDLASIFVQVVVMVTLGAFVVWLANVLLPIIVTSEGLYSDAFSGMKLSTFQSWAEMERVRPIPFTRQLGMPCLIVHSFRKGRRVIVVPLFLARQAQFEEAVREAASPLNPLRQSLENGGEAADRKKLAA